MTTRPSQGFTLVETLIAIAIITLAVAGPLYTAERSLVASETARDQLTASYLAQEAIEYVRMMRDDEYLAAYAVGGSSISSTAWTNFVTGSDAASITSCRASTCTLDPTLPMGTGPGSSLQSCSGGGCGALYLASNGIYTQQNASGSTKTAFVRTVQATDVTGYDERITAKVTWTFHSIPYTITLTDHLTPWQ